jgi:hypothetical protein
VITEVRAMLSHLPAFLFIPQLTITPLAVWQTSAAIFRQTDARCLTDSLSQHMTHLEKAASSLRHQEASMRVGRYFGHRFRKIPLIFSFTNCKFSPFYFFKLCAVPKMVESADKGG